ncbi:MAG: GTP 3',8-cyclase MoaA [Spirochaetaceae bacterium]|nr:GTP 3',8-cyclase MoaA [Spirochaetaceae bacterium]
MVDSHGRNIEYLRLSLTERCNLRCVYCRDRDLSRPESPLSAAQMERILRAMVSLGINRVRLTGGEPLLCADLEQIVAAANAIPRISDLAMTTNGQLLAYRAAGLKRAGLMRINISLDSLRADRYRDITGGGNVSQVLTGIDAALTCGLTPVKLNCVVIRGVNDNEINDFIALAREQALTVRFIELMPLGGIRDDSRRVSTEEILISHGGGLVEIPPAYSGQPAREYTGPGFRGAVGFISAMSRRFCTECNRIRVTSDGKLRPCLGDNREIDLRESLSQGEDALREAIRIGVYRKPGGHHFSGAFESPRKMNRIGG